MSSPLDGNGVAAAEAAFNASINNPQMVPCSKCEGRGFHHGFGEDGNDPDWCTECGGNQFNVVPGEETRAIEAAIAAYLASVAPSQTAVEPVAELVERLRAGVPQYKTQDSVDVFPNVVAADELMEEAASTLTAQAAALAKAEERAEAAERLTAKCYDKVAEFSTRAEAAQRERDKAWNNLSKVATAIGSVRFMDPPDGGDVTLAEQVARMREALEAAEARVAELEADRDQAQRNRDMWKAQCERQAAQAATNTDFLDFVVRRTWDNPLSAEEALSAIQWHPTLKAFYERSRIDPRRLTHQEKNNG